ncbi:MAG: acetate kinase [Gammaproteobacteria bacterium]|nr:acetate kinase [Gammaproteobacteria bacterium]MBL7000697.1 acetate kinase [Gammaproteobacteria bacterium]
MKTLVLNSGSSSIKYSLFEMDDQSVLAAGVIESIGGSHSLHRYKIGSDSAISQTLALADHAQGLHTLFSGLQHNAILQDAAELFCIGHRVVHGGELFRQPVIIDSRVTEKISELSALAPLHNPANVQGIQQALNEFGSVPQVAVFDTAFHQTLPQHAYHYALPRSWYDDFAIRRYGFHGTSHYYVAKKAAEHLARPLAELNLITLHLGNGCSITAIENGKSVDTSMGMTPMEGLMMGTRCGDIDPALSFYVERIAGLSSAEIEQLLNRSSGLKGVCGENDMRAVHRLAESGDQQAQLALDMFAYRIKKYLGAYFAVLGKVDAIVFTGGIGENDSWLRAQCCANLAALGIAIDEEKNTSARAECLDISARQQAVAVLVIRTNEELEIALQSVDCVLNGGS